MFTTRYGGEQEQLWRGDTQLCGLFGVWRFDGGSVDLDSAKRASSVLRHRGPDDEGFLLASRRPAKTVSCAGPDTDKRLSLPDLEEHRTGSFELVFAHRRLAILDPSTAGHQPMSLGTGEIWITHNGEVYNYKELRSELEAYGFRFVTDTDTEVILAAYAKWGPECLLRFNGMWAFAIWDQRSHTLFLARDRFGIKPLYYVYIEGKFCFASEIKALVPETGFGFEPEPSAVHRFLSDGSFPNPQAGGTLFRAVQSLRPGSWMLVRPTGVVVEHRYWDLAESASASSFGPQETVDGYRELLTDAVRLCLRSDVLTGSCLSGGLDSSSIVCLVSHLINQCGAETESVGRRLRTFSAVYETQAPYNERAYVETILGKSGAEGFLTYPTAEGLAADLYALTWHQDEPFQSTSIFAQWCVMRKAHQEGVKVLLDGQGADECLGGYRPYTNFLAELIRRRQFGRAWDQARRLSETSGIPVLESWARALVQQLPYPLLERMRRIRSNTKRALSLLNVEFDHQYGNGEPDDRNAAHSTLSDHLRDLIVSQLPDLLRYEDRNSMAFGIEARVPFLDHRLVEYAFSTAASYRIRHGWTKWVLRAAMEDLVPAETVWRTDKIGFMTPMHEWVTELFRQTPDYFSGEYLGASFFNANLLKEGVSGRQGLNISTPALWRCLSLEAWLRVWRRAGRNSSDAPGMTS